MSALSKAKAAGFALSLTSDGNISIEPFSKLTDIQRQWLKSHKAEIIAELEAANEEPPTLQPWQEAAITAWVYSLGGSPGTIAEELADCLEQCRSDAEALAYYLRRSSERLPIKPTKPPLATCGTCTHFTPHHAHGKGSGDCTSGVKPLGVCHWSETQHPCNQHETN